MGLIKVKTRDGRTLKLFHNVKQTAEHFKTNNIRGFSLRTLRAHDFTQGPYVKGDYAILEKDATYKRSNTDAKYNRMPETRAYIQGPRGQIKQVIKENKRKKQHIIRELRQADGEPADDATRLLMTIQQLIRGNIRADRLNSVKLQIRLNLINEEAEGRTIQTHYMNNNEIIDETERMINGLLNTYAGHFTFTTITLNYYREPNIENVIIFKTPEKFNYKNKHAILEELSNYKHIEYYDILKNCINIVCPTTYKLCFVTCFIMHAENREGIKIWDKCAFFKKMTHTINDTYDILSELLKRYNKHYEVNIYFYKGGSIEKKTYNLLDEPAEGIINLFIYKGHTFLINNDINFIVNDKEQHKQNKQQIIRHVKKSQPHYYYNTFNIFTTTDDDNKATPYAIGIYTGKTYKQFYKQNETNNIINDFIKYIDDMKYNTILYAHGAGKYDTKLLFNELLKSKEINNYLEKENSILNISFFNKNSVNISIRDSKNFLDDTINKLSKAYDTKTPAMDKPIKHNLININNCYIDSNEKIYKNKCIVEYTEQHIKNECITLYEILTKFKNTINDKFDININNVLTNSGIAKNIYFNKFYNEAKHPIYNISVKLEQHIRQFFFGGRNEIFKMGHIEGKINYYDFVSMYPALMSVNNYPIGKMNIINIDETDRNIYNPLWYGLIECEIRHITFNKKPYHGIKHNHNLVFGHIKDFTKCIITSEELKYSLNNNLGYEYKYYKVYNYEAKAPIFKDLIKQVFKMKQEAEQKGQKEQLKTAKLILNSCFGFWATKSERETTQIYNNKINNTKGKDAEYINNKIEKNKNNRFNAFLLSDTLTDYEEINGNSIYKTIERKQQNNNIIIGFFITAQGRTKLYDTIKDIEEAGGTVYYTDTDSIITNYNITENEKLKLKYNVDSGKLGSLTNEATKIYKTLLKEDNISENKINKFLLNNTPYFNDLVILGSKLYALSVDITYKDKNYKYDLMKTRGMDKDATYKNRVLDRENKTLSFLDIGHNERNILNKNDLLRVCKGYTLIINELLYKSNKYTVNIMNIKKHIKSFYDKGTADENGNITPLML